MASEAQIRANRRNALLSTGPRTRDGKARSRLNATQHGLAAELVDNRGMEEDALAAEILSNLPKRGAVEESAPAAKIAGTIARHTATLSRLRALRADALFDNDVDAGALARHLSGQAAPDLGLRLRRLERYERRAVSARAAAIRQLEEVSAWLRDKDCA